MSRRGWNSARAVERATVKRRQRRAPMPITCGYTDCLRSNLIRDLLDSGCEQTRGFVHRDLDQFQRRFIQRAEPFQLLGSHSGVAGDVALSGKSFLLAAPG